MKELFPILALAAMLALCSQAAAATFYVAPNGNDAWSGAMPAPNADKTDGPLASLTAARNAIRKLKAAAPLREPVTVLVRGGVYRITKPFALTPQDSGSPACPITYAAYQDEKPVISGGRVIRGWRREGKLWVADVPEAKAGKLAFRQLFVNGKRARRARTPNEGYFRCPGLVNPKPGARWNVGVDKFRFHSGDLEPWPDLHDAEVVVFHSWNTSRVNIASVDTDKCIVKLVGKTVFRPTAWDGKNQRYYVENTLEALDSPGEWYLNQRTGKLYYWPLPGEDMGAAEVVAPVVERLLEFKGEPEAGLFVEQVRIVGLSFQHADWTLPAKGYGDPQAAVTVPAAIMADGAQHCTLERCELAHVGTYGVWFRRGCKDNRIVQNHIHDLGAGGVRIGEAHMAKDDANESCRNLLSNNYIHDGGHVYPEGVGVWLAQSSFNVISHNEIHSFSYSGLSIGWNWNETPNRTKHNTVEFNHVHHVMRGVLSDGGGIYTLGKQPGMVIRNNVFHDIFPYMGRPAMAWGIYLDQGSTEMLIENNIVYRTLTGGFMNTGRHSNVWRNNVFALSAWQGGWRYTQKGEPPSVFERNIIYLTQGELFHQDGGVNDFKSKWDTNVFWRTDGKDMLFYDLTFAEWQAKGVGAHSLVADPKFVDPQHGDFRLLPDSPALALGIESIDTNKVGLFGPAEWVNLPKQAKFDDKPLPPLPPPPKPEFVDDDFEDTPVGAPPEEATVNLEGKGESIAVTDEIAASGKQCLKFTDAPGLEHIWNPHIFYMPHIRKGMTRLRYDLRVGAGAAVWHEWRDSASPYHVGPSLGIDASGKLTANKQALTTLPSGKWIHFEITCGMGKQATGHYDLVVTVRGQAPQRFSNLPCSSKCRTLDWLGFVSNATDKRVFYLDNIKLETVKP